MTAPIEDGDVVLIVRWRHQCVSSRAGVGMPFTVAGIENVDIVCRRCGELIRGPFAGYRPTGADTAIGIPVAWLRKLDPGADVQADEREAFAQ